MKVGWGEGAALVGIKSCGHMLFVGKFKPQKIHLEAVLLFLLLLSPFSLFLVLYLPLCIFTSNRFLPSVRESDYGFGCP